MIYKSLIPTFGKAMSEPKVGIKNFYKLSHARMFSRPKILFLVSLHNFFIILVCLLFKHSIILQQAHKMLQALT